MRPPPASRSLALLALLLLGTATPAGAHTSGLSKLRLTVAGARVSGEWEIHLHDARVVIGLPPTLAPDSGLAELRAQEATYRDHLLHRLRIQADGVACSLRFLPDSMRWDPAMSSLTLRLAADCPTEPRKLVLSYDLMFDRDPTHRGFFSVQDDRVTHVGVFRADRDRVVEIRVRHFRWGETVVEFVREGVLHIWGGIDHLLFLLALLLPAALTRVGGDWAPRPGFWPTAGEVVKVVTAFTIAHTLTLVAAFFGVLRLPSAPVESVIALSVFAAAWNNLRPFLPGRTWWMALGFGLVHGLGFAGALSGLSLPRQARGLALGAFNVGVELGQLAIVAIALPLLFVASRWKHYPRLLMGIGSVLIATIAVVWFLERAFGLALR